MDNTPPGYEDKALIAEYEYDFTDDEYLIDELPHISHLDTEDQNFEQE
jgi:hypothetical protein